MRRRFAYALTAGLLSSGAPTGLLGIRLARRANGESLLRELRREIIADRAAYMCIGGATALIFAMFGYVLGRQADRLAELSETDALTGLLNARGFSGRLRGEIKRAARYREPMTLLFLDLDELKRINDRHGHRAGNEAIRQTASIIDAELRESDVGARWGGDEFAILAPNTAPDAAESLAERIRRQIADYSDPWPLTASIGVATLEPGAGDAPDDSVLLLRAADAAMYKAKKRGKNTVVMGETVGPERPALATDS